MQEEEIIYKREAILLRFDYKFVKGLRKLYYACNDFNDFDFTEYMY